MNSGSTLQSEMKVREGMRPQGRELIAPTEEKALVRSEGKTKDNEGIAELRIREGDMEGAVSCEV